MPRLTFSNTVFQGNNAFSWNTKAMSRGIGPATRLPARPAARACRGAGGGRHPPADDVEQGRLAAAARPDEAKELAARNVERGVAQRAHVAGVALLAELMRDAPDPDRDGARSHGSDP